MPKWVWKHGKIWRVDAFASRKHHHSWNLSNSDCHSLAAEEAFLPEGPDGPEIDVSVPLTRQIFETAAADVLKRLKEVAYQHPKW